MIDINNPYHKHLTPTKSPSITKNEDTDCSLQTVPAYTEAVLIISGSVCFIVFFQEMEKFIIDKHNLMTDSVTAKRNMIQLVAIYFAIYVLLIIGMSPLYHYAYSSFVVGIVLTYTGIRLLYRIYTLDGNDLNIVNQIPVFKSHSNF